MSENTQFRFQNNLKKKKEKPLNALKKIGKYIVLVSRMINEEFKALNVLKKKINAADRFQANDKYFLP